MLVGQWFELVVVVLVDGQVQVFFVVVSYIQGVGVVVDGCDLGVWVGGFDCQCDGVVVGVEVDDVGLVWQGFEQCQCLVDQCFGVWLWDQCGWCDLQYQVVEGLLVGEVG